MEKKGYDKHYESGKESLVYKTIPHDKELEEPIEEVVSLLKESKEKDFNPITQEEHNKKMGKALDKIILKALINMQNRER